MVWKRFKLALACRTGSVPELRSRISNYCRSQLHPRLKLSGFGGYEPQRPLLRALGTYIHPPVTKDLTNQVTWASNTPESRSSTLQVLLILHGIGCGSAVISATLKTNIQPGTLSGAT